MERKYQLLLRNKDWEITNKRHIFWSLWKFFTIICDSSHFEKNFEYILNSLYCNTLYSLLSKLTGTGRQFGYWKVWIIRRFLLILVFSVCSVHCLRMKKQPFLIIHKNFWVSFVPIWENLCIKVAEILKRVLEKF